jgi:hypothetical protein
MQSEKKDLDDFDDKNFIQIALVENGKLIKKESNSDYSYILDELARRTNDESGNYYVKSFNVSLKNSLNNLLGNDGIYKKGEVTQQGSIPEENLAVYKVSPGKAYVRGYEVDVISPAFLDVEKPRTTKELTSQAINFDFGPQLEVNRIYGTPFVGFNTSSTVSLRDSRIGSTHSSASGSEIGIARVYDFYLKSGSYDSSNLDSNVWNISLFDIQTYSEITISESITLDIPCRIIGEQSGSTAFLKSAVSNSTTLVLYQINGIFSKNESIRIISNSDENRQRRYITDIKNYGISDIKSIYSSYSGSVFNADTVQKVKYTIGNASIAAKVGTSSTISLTTDLSSRLEVGNIVSFSEPGITTVTYGAVSAINGREITIDEVEAVTQVTYGILPSTDTNIVDLKILDTKLLETEFTGNSADNQSLFSIFPNENIESVEFTNTNL